MTRMHASRCRLPGGTFGSCPAGRTYFFCLVATFSFYLGPFALAADEAPEGYIKVKVKDKYELVALPLAALDAGKTLDVMVQGILNDGVVAIGAETTGTVIKVGKTTWELDLSADPKFKKAAEAASGKVVVVTGKVQKKKGVEVKERTIVKVETLKGA